MSPGRKVSSSRGAVPFGLSFAIADLIVMLLEREAHPAGALGILVQLFACRPATQSATARTSNTAMKILRNVYMTIVSAQDIIEESKRRGTKRHRVWATNRDACRRRNTHGNDVSWRQCQPRRDTVAMRCSSTATNDIPLAADRRLPFFRRNAAPARAKPLREMRKRPPISFLKIQRYAKRKAG
jgi:hypothetical protein